MQSLNPLRVTRQLAVLISMALLTVAKTVVAATTAPFPVVVGPPGPPGPAGPAGPAGPRGADGVATVYTLHQVLPDNSMVVYVDASRQHGILLQSWETSAGFGDWYAANLNVQNLGPNWRLPTLLELQLIILDRRNFPAIYANYSGLSSFEPFWTSTAQSDPFVYALSMNWVSGVPIPFQMKSWVTRALGVKTF